MPEVTFTESGVGSFSQSIKSPLLKGGGGNEMTCISNISDEELQDGLIKLTASSATKTL